MTHTIPNQLRSTDLPSTVREQPGTWQQQEVQIHDNFHLSSYKQQHDSYFSWLLKCLQGGVFFVPTHPDLTMISLGIQLEIKDKNLIHQMLLTTFMTGSLVHVGSFKPNTATCPK